SAWHLYVIRLNVETLKIDRNQFIDELKKRGIGTSVHFIPLHRHPYYKKNFQYKSGEFPVSDKSFERIISLPIYPSMTEGDIDRVINSVEDVVRQYRR
ncbi:MAG: DegT/DnrJ/EryC1/StrS family aminotransferase, partial [Thermodesulfovibrionales bacterium]